MARRRRLVGLALVAAATVGCDHITKHAATGLLAGAADRSYFGDTLRLGYAENTGGFLSLGANLPVDARTAIFTVMTGLALMGLVALAVRKRSEGWSTVGLVLFASGGVSNWIDRAAQGRVVDFLNVGIGSLRTGVFNVADVAIMVGAGLFALAEARAGRGDDVFS